MTITEKIKDCKFVLASLLDEQERIVLRNENKIVQLNVVQFEKGSGSDNKALKNNNPIFDGTYSFSTNLLNPNKRAGDLYNFFVTGDFLNGMQLELDSSLIKVDLFSTGTGSGDKSIFFAGYSNLFGLNNNNAYVLNYEIVYPELMNFIHKYI